MLKKLILTLLTFTAAPALSAQATVDVDPALWVVKDDDTTIYLFGTYHLLDEKREWFNDNVKVAFDASSELVVEAKLPEDPADLQPLIVKYAIDPEGRKLSSRLPEETAKKLGEELTALGAPPTAFEPFEPWFASMTIAALKMQSKGLKAEKGPEKVLLSAAAEENKQVTELEGLEYQLKLFDSMPEAQQVAYLKETLAELSKSDAMIEATIDAWANGKPEVLAEILSEGTREDPALYELLFTRRNSNWADWIDERLDRPGVVFVGVGAGHLAGEGSVQAQLAERGITSDRVPTE